MDMKRRQFLRTSLAGLGSAAVAGAPLPNARAEEAKAPKNPFSTDPCALVQLTPQVKTSRIGFGTGMIGHNRSSTLTRMDRKKATELILYGYERGIRYFDCADLYGTHQIVTETLAAAGIARDTFQIGTKIWPHGGGIPEKERPRADVVVKRFLQETKSDYLDLVQIHCMSTPTWDEQFGQYMEDLEALKQEGLIRAHGVSTHTRNAVKRAIELDWTDAIHIPMNTTGARMDGSFEENAALAKAASEKNIGVICMKVVGEGTMKKLEDRQRSIDAIVRLNAVDTMIVGFNEKHEIDEFIDNVSATLKAMEAEQAAAKA
ncbi:MAG: aldo/keto reductase [Thermoguttaceae bacterium]|nr:aldo/keto reductase [Thermoguttaceae bacterium]